MLDLAPVAPVQLTVHSIEALSSKSVGCGVNCCNAAFNRYTFV
jgi:hypothetical protein